MKKTILTLILIVIILGTAVQIYKSSDQKSSQNTAEQTAVSENETESTGTETKSENNTVVTTNTNTPAVSNVNLEGTTFRMTSYNGEEIQRGSNYTLTFTEGRIAAKICNNMNGAYTLQDGVLKAEQMISTMMYCGSHDNLMEIENTFGTVLGEGVTFSLAGSNLVLVSKDGTMMAFTVFMD